MTNGKKTIGAAIDEIVAALQGLDELARATAVRAACEHLGVVPPQSASIPPSGGEPPPPVGAQTISLLRQRQWLRTYEPSRNRSGRRPPRRWPASLPTILSPFSSKRAQDRCDHQRHGEVLLKQAGFRLPTRIAQLLVDAKSSGYLDSAGHGKYRLNPVGHNLVVHSLPKSKES